MEGEKNENNKREFNMKKFLVIIISLMFCFWFSETVVNATPPEISLKLDVEYESKQDLNNIKLTVYFGDVDSPFIDNDRESIYYVIIDEYDNDLSSNHYHTNDELLDSILNNEKVKCEKGCIVDLYGLETYLNHQDAYLYFNRYYSFKKQYVLSKEMFTKNEGKLSVGFFNAYRIYSNNTFNCDISRHLQLDYRIENGYIYLSGQEKEVTVTSSNCSIQ